MSVIISFSVRKYNGFILLIKVLLSDKNYEIYKKKILTFILERFENLLKSQSLEKFLIYKALKLDQRSIDINNIYEKCEAIFNFIRRVLFEP